MTRNDIIEDMTLHSKSLRQIERAVKKRFKKSLSKKEFMLIADVSYAMVRNFNKLGFPSLAEKAQKLCDEASMKILKSE